jgi:hypothetical protein
VRARRARRWAWVAEMWEARAGRWARWGGRGEGVREGWVWAREVRRAGEVRRGVSWEVLGGRG